MQTARAPSSEITRGHSWLRQAIFGTRAAAPPDANVERPRPTAVPKPQRADPPHVHQFEKEGWGHTVLVDSDGHGVIQIGDVTLTECAPAGHNTWVDASRDFCLYTIKRSGGSTDLAICRRGKPQGDCIVVHDWSPTRSLGIRLGSP